jgi:hypothetical protein
MDDDIGGRIAPFPSARLCAAEWDAILLLLQTRSGGRCEARTTSCMARNGELRHLTRQQVSIHHRKARNMGGTHDPACNSLANLVLICGSGTTGCHGRIEGNLNGDRDWGYNTGWLVRHSTPGRPTPATDPAQVPLLLPCGLWIRLDPLHPERPTELGYEPFTDWETGRHSLDSGARLSVTNVQSGSVVARVEHW